MSDSRSKMRRRGVAKSEQSEAEENDACEVERNGGVDVRLGPA